MDQPGGLWGLERHSLARIMDEPSGSQREAGKVALQGSPSASPQRAGREYKRTRREEQGVARLDLTWQVRDLDSGPVLENGRLFAPELVAIRVGERDDARAFDFAFQRG